MQHLAWLYEFLETRMSSHARSDKNTPRQQPAPTPAAPSNQSAGLNPQVLRQIQRLHRTGAKSASFIQSRLISPARRLQRRVPEAAEVGTLLGDKNAGIAAANLKGLRTAVERMY